MNGSTVWVVRASSHSVPRVRRRGALVAAVVTPGPSCEVKHSPGSGSLNRRTFRTTRRYRSHGGLIAPAPQHERDRGRDHPLPAAKPIDRSLLVDFLGTLIVRNAGSLRLCGTSRYARPLRRFLRRGLLRRSLPCDYSMLRHGCVTAGPETPGRYERQPGSAEHLLPAQLAEVGHQALGRQLAGIRRADTCCSSYRRFWEANRGQFRTEVSSGGLAFLHADCPWIANRPISFRHVGGGGSIRAPRGGDRQEGGRLCGPNLVSVPGAGHGQCRSTLPRPR